MFEELIESQKTQEKRIGGGRPMRKKSSSANSASSQSENSSQPVSVKRYQKPPTRVTPPRAPQASQGRQRSERAVPQEQPRARGRPQQVSESSSHAHARSDSYLERQLQAKLLDREFKDLLQQEREERIEIQDGGHEEEGESGLHHEYDSEGNSQQLDIQVPTFQNPHPGAKASNSKAHESNTTRAESYLTLHGAKPAEATNIFSFASGASAGHHSLPREPRTAEEPQPAPPEPQGQLSKKLKELMRMSGSGAGEEQGAEARLEGVEQPAAGEPEPTEPAALRGAAVGAAPLAADRRETQKEGRSAAGRAVRLQGRDEQRPEPEEGRPGPPDRQEEERLVAGRGRRQDWLRALELPGFQGRRGLGLALLFLICETFLAFVQS